MATLLLPHIRALNDDTRILLLILLILAIALIVAGAIITIVTYLFVRKQRASMPE
jgi:hypothetical protein